MSLPTLERRPTHHAGPLLQSEISRLTHRRLARVMALILLGGIVLISTIAFFMHSKEAGCSPGAAGDATGTSSSATGWSARSRLQTPSRLERYCGREPATQPLERFDWGEDPRYKAYELLPVALIGALSRRRASRSSSARAAEGPSGRHAR